MYIVESESDSTTHPLSKGNSVPSPLFLAQGLLSSHSKVSSNNLLMFSGSNFTCLKHSLAFSFHPLLLKSKNHCPSIKATIILSPLLDKAFLEVSNIKEAFLFPKSSHFTFSFASLTLSPLYLPHVSSINPL